MIASDLIRLVAVAALAVVDASGHLTFALLVVLRRSSSGLGRRALLPRVRRDGAARRRAAEHRLGELADRRRPLEQHPRSAPRSPALIYRPAGSAAVFAVDALRRSLVSALVRLPDAAARDRGGRARGHVRARSSPAPATSSRIPWLWVTIVLFGVVLMLQLAPQQVLMPKLVDRRSGTAAIGAYALLTTLMGVGTVTGALLFGQIQPRRRRGVISYVFWVLNSLAVVGIALSPWYPLAGVADGAARHLRRVRRRDLGDDADGARPREPALAGGQPRLLRLVRADARRAGLRRRGLGASPIPATLIAAGAGLNAIMLAVVLTRPWLRAVD